MPSTLPPKGGLSDAVTAYVAPQATREQQATFATFRLSAARRVPAWTSRTPGSNRSNWRFTLPPTTLSQQTRSPDWT